MVPPVWRHVARCFWEQRIGPGESSYPQRVLPDGCADVLVAPSGHAFVVGTATGATVAYGAPGSVVRGLRLRPSGVRAVLGVPAAELRDRKVPLDAVLGSPLAREAADAVLAAGTRRSRRVTAWLSDAMPKPRVAAACRWLWCSSEVDVADVAVDVSLSARQLRRVLRDEVGLGPKTFQRVGRLHRFLTIAERAGEPWALVESALAAGYSDQAHLGREIQELAGTTPLRLLREREVGWRMAETVTGSPSAVVPADHGAW
ncbi:DUF6597 domain-containing transcriptional factor [Marinactinospora rubrisoli]|uniref:DUF6597 domain-containing transcriptional factor n=1 Tax=Marinactinospora rubrisoli TaxID=2715399 RepID=A0ABW2KKS7_9ACTN